MKAPLFSSAHIEAAKKLFPEKIIDLSWLNSQWTDEEINQCKQVEFGEEFENNPTIELLEKKFLGGSKIECFSDDIQRWSEHVIASNRLNILSVGCGDGIREMSLALKGKCKRVIGVDISPYTSILNQALPRHIASLVTFMKSDSMRLPFADNSFEMVMSHGVTYCMPDHLLQPYFTEMVRVLKPGGTCLLSCSSNLSFAHKIIQSIKGEEELRTSPKKLKKIGWLRDKKK